MSEQIRRTFSKRLSRTIILLAIPLFMLSLGSFYQYARVLLHKEALQRSRTILSTTERLVENYLSAIETAAKSNAWLLEENFTPDSLPALSRRIVKLNGSVLSCSVAAEPDAFPEQGSNFSVYSVREGDSIITALEPEFEYYQKNWYKKPIQLGAPCWINPFSDFTEGLINHHDAVGSYCIPLRPHGNRIEGVVSVDFSFQTLRKTVLATHHPYPSSYFMLLGPAGGYLIHPESNLLFKKTIFTATDSVEHPDIIALGRAMTSGKHGMMHVSFDDVLCHVTYMPVGDTRWSLALVCHDEDVLADYNHLAVLLIIFVIMGMVVIAWLTRKVVRRNIQPLNELMEATTRVSKGDYDTEIAPTSNKDIIGNMQNAFRNMQKALISHRNEIRKGDADIAKKSAELESSLPLAKEAANRKQLFVKNVWHQIVTPLNVIESLARVLQGGIASGYNSKAGENRELGEDIRQISNTMKRNAVVLYRNTLMLYDISDTSTANTARYHQNDQVCCNEMGLDSVNYIKGHFADAVIGFETELPDTYSIKTNRLYLMLTLRELLYNSAKYSDKQHILLRVTQTDDTVRFTIEDVGPDLPDDFKKIIFEPFKKISELSDGLGLGLPLCKIHIESLGGKVIYDESYQQGCRMIVELPKR